MYHVELRQFPHNFCRFNLTEKELREAVVDAWAQGEWIEFGERKWNPHQAHLTVLEGPQLPLEQLSMGRGWRIAVREGQDVTEQLLVAARADAAGSSDEGPASSTRVDPGQESVDRKDVTDPKGGEISAEDLRLLADSLGLEVLTRLSEDPVSLALVWRLACERHPEWSASDSLKLAEGAVRSLVGSQLAIVLLGDLGDEPQHCTSERQLDAALHSIESWSSAASQEPVWIRRA
ncbi:MAG TPA: hypothetical protein VK701_04375 [Solirubrobacteraceae bacterium]|jgi:hypothetical protein|nr:hypothetical protein [Solirubrobacteraceae bacterium]